MIEIIAFLLRKLKAQRKFINVSVFLQIFQNLISQKFRQGTSSATQLSALKKQPADEKQLLPGRVRPPLLSFHLPSTPRLPPGRLLQQGMRNGENVLESHEVWVSGSRAAREQGLKSWQWVLWEKGDGHKGKSPCGRSGQQRWELHYGTASSQVIKCFKQIHSQEGDCEMRWLISPGKTFWSRQIVSPKTNWIVRTQRWSTSITKDIFQRATSLDSSLDPRVWQLIVLTWIDRGVSCPRDRDQHKGRGFRSPQSSRWDLCQPLT